ncbi:hypothetical protein HS99_0040130 [Kitasatospora aureofaciens]|uniref:Uncharacterized protein n=1 Tax=Kitasatospora aureofaciens TaxID=1894 RepID=A0A1E7MVV3_KITAU|nr:hypothetical protein HS99_0040130 [Kitasatospora aureofaciens]GGV06732.1 hypothetical protein GCM10010502_72170 [Kitasatospora aureofaciens]
MNHRSDVRAEARLAGSGSGVALAVSAQEPAGGIRAWPPLGGGVTVRQVRLPEGGAGVVVERLPRGSAGRVRVCGVGREMGTR